MMADFWFPKAPMGQPWYGTYMIWFRMKELSPLSHQVETNRALEVGQATGLLPKINPLHFSVHQRHGLER